MVISSFTFPYQNVLVGQPLVERSKTQEENALRTAHPLLQSDSEGQYSSPGRSAYWGDRVPTVVHG